MFPTNGRPGDERGFLHKSFIGKAVGKAITTFVPGASTAVGAFNTVKSFAGGGRGRSFGRGRPAPLQISTPRPTAPRTQTARISLTSQAEKNVGRALKFPEFAGGGTGFSGGSFAGNVCDFPKVIDDQGRCRMPTSGALGGEQFGVGEAVMGRYGAALEPGSQIVDRAICLRGMQLGNDGLCYNKGQISNKQRMWPAGRKPLLTGGDMRAISTAARAGRRMELATKRLQRMGMMKKPAGRRAIAPHRHAKAATGVVSV